MSTIAAGTTSGTALVSTGDTNGTLVLQTNGTTTAVTIGTNQVVTLAQPLPAGSGGTGITTTPTAGAVPYGNGSTLAFTAAGTSGQVLLSGGLGAPTWGSSGVTATAKGSVLGFSPSSPVTKNGIATISAFGTPNLFTTPLRTSTFQTQVGNGSDNTGSFMGASYSTYYGGWFAVSLAQTALPGYQNILFSYDGFSWSTISATIALLPSNNAAFGVCANDYTGDIYLLVSSSTGTTVKMYASTDKGASFSVSQTVDASNNSQFGYAGLVFIDTGTQSTSRAVAWWLNVATNLTVSTLAGNGNPASGWATPSGGTASGLSTMGYSYRLYGTKLCLYGDSVMVYDAATNTATSHTPAALGISNTSTGPNNIMSVAFNNSYWASGTTTSIRYGTVSGTALTAVGTVALSVSSGTLGCFFYDGTYWYAIGQNGLWYTAAANPSTGWTKANPNLGFMAWNGASGFIGQGGSGLVFQRNPV